MTNSLADKILSMIRTMPRIYNQSNLFENIYIQYDECYWVYLDSGNEDVIFENMHFDIPVRVVASINGSYGGRIDYIDCVIICSKEFDIHSSYFSKFPTCMVVQ